MRYGTVVQYFSDKGFGFIRPDVGADVFFHITALGACETEPVIEAGQPVKFELAPKKYPQPQDSDSPQKETARSGEPPRLQAKLVELIDKIPGAVLEEEQRQKAAHHPRARQKKPTWRR